MVKLNDDQIAWATADRAAQAAEAENLSAHFRRHVLALIEDAAEALVSSYVQAVDLVGSVIGGGSG